MEEKKSFWKNKKNVAIVILSILLFFSIMSTSGDTTPNATAAELKSQLNVIIDEKTSLDSKLKSAENRVNYLSAELENKTKIEQVNETEKTKLKEYENQIEVLLSEKNELEVQVKSLTSENDSLKKAKQTASTEVSNNNEKTTKSIETSNNPQPASAESNNSYTVYITNTGSKYHRDGCSYLKSKNAIDKNNAIAQGYTPCSRCNP